MAKRLILSTLLLIMLVFLSFPSDTEAADFRSGSEVTIGPEETVNDDLYAAGGTVNVNGIIDGDLVAAGGTINVRGAINGDVIAAGGSVIVNGMVRDNVRASGGNVVIHSTVLGDVVAAGGSVELEPGASVGRDMVVGAGSIQIDGNIGRDVLLGAGSATINGTVGGDVRAELGDGLTLGPMARIEGNLTVTSPQEIEVAQGAAVLGNTVYEEPTTSLFWVRVRETAGIQVVQDIVSRVQWFLGTALVGLLLLWIVPRTLEGTSETVIRSPWSSLGLGVAVLILAPIVIVIAAVIAIFIGGFAGVPVAVVPTAVYLALLVLTAPVIGFLIGRYLLGRLRGSRAFAAWQALLLGVLILALIGFVPFLNWIVTLLTLLFGFGAWVLFLYRHYREARQAESV
jgi:cytoskeletal protein CcmA (bactofilin family)